MKPKSEFIKAYKDQIPVDLCDKLVSMFNDNKDQQIPGIISRGAIDVQKSTDMRVVSTLDMWKEVDQMLSAQVSKALEVFYKDHEALRFISNEFFDSGYYIQTYDNNDNDEYDWHCDRIGSDTVHRVLTLIVFLNDVEEGGETEFKYFSNKIKPLKGSVAIFPASFEYVYRANKPKSNKKYVLYTFLSHKPVMVKSNHTELPKA